MDKNEVLKSQATQYFCIKIHAQCQKNSQLRGNLGLNEQAKTHLGWSSSIDLRLGSVLLLEVSGSIFTDVNLGGLI